MFSIMVLVFFSVMLGANVQTLILRWRVSKKLDEVFLTALVLTVVSFILIGIFAYKIG